MEASIFGDFEQHLTSFTLRPFDDGRFVVKANGTTIYDMDRTSKFPRYDQDIKPRLSAML